MVATTASRSDRPKIWSNTPNKHSLRVCLASQAPFVGGAEVAAERLALGLQEAGHEVLVILGTDGEVLQRMQQAGLRCRFAPMPFTDRWHWWRYRQARRALERLLRQERSHIIHNNDLRTHQIMSDAARRLGIPRICHHRFPFEQACIDWMNKFGAERHLFVSQALMQEMCAQSERLAHSSRAVVYDGLPLPPVPTEADRQRARQQLRLPHGRAIVTFVGQIIECKGVADLLHAWSALGETWHQRAELVIVGDDLQGQGAYRMAMQELARQLGCPARFVGFQKNPGQWLTASDLALVPSHVEPLGNATLEAMAHALPVIGCAVGGIPEMIVHDQTGLLMPSRKPEQLANAIARVLSNEEKRRQLGMQGRQRCEELFSLQAHVQSVLDEYRMAFHPSPNVRGADVPSHPRALR